MERMPVYDSSLTVRRNRRRHGTPMRSRPISLVRLISQARSMYGPFGSKDARL